MSEPHPFDAVRSFADRIEQASAAARTAADFGDDNPLSIIDTRHGRAPDEGLLREVRAEDPELGARVDRLLRHRWRREGEVRASLASAEVVVANRTVSLSRALEGVGAIHPAERASYAEAVDSAIDADDFAVFEPPTRTTTAPKLARSPGGIVLLDFAEKPGPSDVDDPEEARWTWQPIAALVEALTSSVVDGVPVHVARCAAEIADFRVAEPRPGAGWRTSDDVLAAHRLQHAAQALRWCGAATPIARDGARVFAEGGADRTVAAVVAAAPLWTLGAARVLAAIPQQRIIDLLEEKPTKVDRAGRAIALAVTSMVLDDLLAIHAAGDADILEALAHAAYPGGTEAERTRAQLFARRYGMARLPGERALYRYGGGRWLDAICTGVTIATELRNEFDEDWYRNPRVTMDLLRSVGARAEPAGAAELIDWVSEAAAL